MASETTNVPEIVKLLMAQPDAQRLVHALLEAAAWIASPEAQDRPTDRAAIARELESLVQLEREIRTLSLATETRWDGKSSAFIQADSIASEDRTAWLQSLRRLADALDAVRPPRAGEGLARL